MGKGERGEKTKIPFVASVNVDEHFLFFFPTFPFFLFPLLTLSVTSDG